MVRYFLGEYPLPGFRIYSVHCGKNHGKPDYLPLMPAEGRAGDRRGYPSGQADAGQAADDRTAGFDSMEDLHDHPKRPSKGKGGAGDGEIVWGIKILYVNILVWLKIDYLLSRAILF